MTETNMERVKRWKSKIFYNPIIRYLFLSSLKINMISMVAFRRASGDAVSVLMATVLLLAITAVPIFFAKLLHNNRDRLEDEANVKKFGTIYAGRNVNSDKKHQVWIYPLSFFFRRAIFMMATVFLAEWPSL